MEYLTKWPLWKYLALRDIEREGYGKYYYDVDNDVVISERLTEKQPISKRISETYLLIGNANTINQVYRDIKNKRIPKIPAETQKIINLHRQQDPFLRQIFASELQSTNSPLVNSQRQPISGQRQPISGQRQPTNGQRQPTSGQRQPTDGQKHSIVTGNQQSVPIIEIGDIGTQYFSTAYGKPHQETFTVIDVNKTGRQILIKWDDQHQTPSQIWLEWRRPGNWIPKGKTAKDYKNYYIEMGPSRPIIEDNTPY